MILFLLLSSFFKSEALETEEAFNECEAAQRFANKKLSAWLEKPPEPATSEERRSYDYCEQLKPDFNPPFGYFDARNKTLPDGTVVDVPHPSSKRVNWKDEDGAPIDYSVNPGPLGGPEALYIPNRVFADESVKQDMRDVLLANNMHRCCPTCWKYGVKGICRSFFPFDVQIDDPDDPDYTGKAQMRTRMGRRGRVRVSVESARNNKNMNRHASQPTVSCTWRGNVDQTCVKVLYHSKTRFNSLTHPDRLSL